MNSSKIMLLMLVSFGCENLKASEELTKSTSGKEIDLSKFTIIHSKELDLIYEWCFDCTKEDKADLKEFGSQLKLEYTPYVEGRTYRWYSWFNGMISSDRIGDVEEQFVVFRAAKNAELSMIAAKENLKRVKVALHYDNLNKSMQQSLDLN